MKATEAAATPLFETATKFPDYSGGRLLVKHQSSTQPGDLWVYDIRRREPRQLTFSAIASLTAAKIPPSQLVCYRSFDGKIISAFMWVPFNLKRDGSNPAIVLPHGGPTWAAGTWRMKSTARSSWKPPATLTRRKSESPAAPTAAT